MALNIPAAHETSPKRKKRTASPKADRTATIATKKKPALIRAPSIRKTARKTQLAATVLPLFSIEPQARAAPKQQSDQASDKVVIYSVKAPVPNQDNSLGTELMSSSECVSSVTASQIQACESRSSSQTSSLPSPYFEPVKAQPTEAEAPRRVLRQPAVKRPRTTAMKHSTEAAPGALPRQAGAQKRSVACQTIPVIITSESAPQR